MSDDLDQQRFDDELDENNIEEYIESQSQDTIDIAEGILEESCSPEDLAEHYYDVDVGDVVSDDGNDTGCHDQSITTEDLTETEEKSSGLDTWYHDTSEAEGDFEAGKECETQDTSNNMEALHQEVPMPENSDIRHFDIMIDEDDFEEAILSMLYELRPDWMDKTVVMEELPEAKVNKMLCYYLEEDGDRCDGIVVRIHLLNDGSYASGLRRENEVRGMQLAQTVGCFTQLYATFNNGVIYRYFEGRTLNFYDITEPTVIKEITRKLCDFNSCDFEAVDLVSVTGGLFEFDKQVPSLERMGRVIEGIPSYPSDPMKSESFLESRKIITNEYLHKELNFMKSVLDEMQMETGLVHGEFHPRNIVYNERTGEVCFVDYETTTWGYRVQDLSRILGIRFYMVLLNLCDPAEPDITPEVRQMWLRSYLEARYENEAKNPDDVTETDLELLDIETMVMDTVYVFKGMVYAFLDIPLFKGVDFLGLVLILQKRYFHQKSAMIDLKDRYLDLKKSRNFEI